MPIQSSADRTLVFIDGHAIYNCSHLLNFQMDYLGLKNYFEKNYKLVRIHYYTTLKYDGPDDDFQKLRPLLDYLDYNGFALTTKDLVEIPSTSGASSRYRGTIRMELALDAVTLCHNADRVILVTGDGEYTYAIKKIQELGKIVTVISSRKTTPVAVSDDLRRQADEFIDMADIQQFIARKEPAK